MTKRVFLAMPRGGDQVTAAALEAALQDHGPGLSVTFEGHPSSLLQFGYTELWAKCLNSKKDYDWLAMLHSDVVPRGPFLRTLIEQAIAGGFEVMHSPQAIKEVRGITSTMGAFSLDPWALKRRLTVTELQHLPDTFGVEEINACLGWDAKYLLPNSGCIVIKLGPAWRRFPGFHCLTRSSVWFPGTREVIPAADVTDVRFEDPHQFVAQVVDEDALLGLWCAERGLKVGGTRLVPSNHHGLGQYPNDCEWGTSDVDEAYFAVRAGAGV